jgi:hypothetical protein
MNPEVQALWEEYRQVVRTVGHGKETKEILNKIYDLNHSLAPCG